MKDENKPANRRKKKALTLPAKRLAGNTHCLNCGTILQGPFCHYCGQPDRNFMRFFPVLLRELMEDFLDFDSRFTRTLKPLLFQPGKLTRDYLDGKRFRYTPPLRLYIFSSIAFFFIAALLTVNAIRLDTQGGEDSDRIVRIGLDAASETEELREASEGLPPGVAERVEEALIRAEAARQAELEPGEAEPGEAEIEAGEDNVPSGGPANAEDAPSGPRAQFNFNGEPWDRETNPLIIPWIPDFVNDWINDEIEKSPEKGRKIEANPNLIVNKVFDLLPITMFVLLPLAALLLKFWYLFSGRYYIEHLIYALHNHSFLFVVLLLATLAEALGGSLEPVEQGPVRTATSWFTTAIAAWIPIYFLISLKRVYRQGWGMTLLKYVLVGTSYIILLAFATAVVALLSFLLL